MDRRKRLGLVYLYSKGWLGGMYYIQSLVLALNTLEDDKKPLINVYCLSEDAFEELCKSTKYPYMVMTHVTPKFYKIILRKILSFISIRQSLKINSFKLSPSDDIIYPLGRGGELKKLVFWRPDFQEKYYPDYFSNTEIKRRDREIKEICHVGIPLVLSSNACLDDFHRFYPQYKQHPTFVIHFAVTQPDFSKIDFYEVQKKYGIKKRYLFCANQFWQHKNHLFLFKSFKKALDMGLDLDLVCTGNLNDLRNKDYINDVKAYLESNDFKKRVRILGVIDKLEMLCLMKHSYAVIQPSLFEGWNTTVEDCKAMNKFVYLSDIPVHREQKKDNVCFFDPKNEEDLVLKLLTIGPTELSVDYHHSIKKFAEDFNKVIDTIVTNS